MTQRLCPPGLGPAGVVVVVAAAASDRSADGSADP